MDKSSTGSPAKVKAHFEQSAIYLSENYNIKLRGEIVSAFLGNAGFSSVLDVACGNAEISRPFLHEGNRLTLLDISENMLKEAEQNIPQLLKGNVGIFCGDFLATELPERAYDLIICTGLLAHISDPLACLQKIASLLMPGGSLILQNTNSRHWFSRLNNLYRKLGILLDAQRYSYNKVSEAMIMETLAQYELLLVRRSCYIQSFMFLDRVISPEIKYWLIRNTFGLPAGNRLAYLGNDCIYLFRKRSAGSHES